jgi:hypothetical protein
LGQFFVSFVEILASQIWRSKVDNQGGFSLCPFVPFVVNPSVVFTGVYQLFSVFIGG